VPYNSYGDHFLEKLLVAINPNCVLDFDDDIGAQESKEKSRFDRLLFAANNQFYDSFHFYQSFIVGSEYLSLIVQKYKPNAEVIIIPTCVNYTSFLPKKYEVTGDQTVTFGWIGGNQNLFLLKNIIPALNRVADEYSIRLLVIAGVDDYNFEAKFPIEYVRFSLETEKEYLRKMDIGLMPLLDDEVSRGKCGFKLLQYMGLAVPGIASAVTINMEIIQDGQNGWLVDPTVDWYDTLILVIKQKDRWKEIGHNAHQTVDSRYSFKANEDRYIHFIIKHLSYGN
jgi:Glycosyltransferase